MEKKQFSGQKDIRPVKRSEMDKKLEPTNVAESKRAEWEQQQRSKD